jgi:antitoxin (DNA-binding transcriptional repressor) of toxin-antitoxin stability system
METKITSTQLAKRLSDILNRVRYRGEQFVVERNGEPIALLGPARAPSSITLRELAARLADLDLPGDGFADDLESIQAAQSKAGFPEWPN